MTTQPPAFQFYAQDFLTGVIYLTNEEIGIYIKLLAKQWTDGKIPKKRLGFLAGIDWENFSDELKSKFTDYGEFVINERLEKEREKKVKFLQKQATNGKKGGRPRKNNVSESPIDTEEKPNPLNNNNPNKTQKKPLENENEKEEEKEKEIDNDQILEKSEKPFEKFPQEIKTPEPEEIIESKIFKDCKSFFAHTTPELQMKMFSDFRRIYESGKFEEFKKQTFAYIEYKKLSKETKHRWQSYAYEWQNENWIGLLADLNAKNTKTKINVQSDKKVFLNGKFGKK